MDTIEKQALSDIQSIVCFKWYGDDCFEYTKNEECALEFQNIFNAEHHNVHSVK